jgi:hypothetical protein
MIQSKTYGLQNETRQYLRRLYAYGRELAPADVADIDNFVKGLKQLNLWQNIIDFWLLKPTYNTGTGSIVLGFFGKYNGTLVNSPSWSDIGISFTAGNQNINLSRGLDFLGFRGIREFTNLATLKTDTSNNNSHICGVEAYLPTNPTTGSIHSIFGPTGNRVLNQSSLTGGNRQWGSANNTNVGIGFYFAASGRNNLNVPEISDGFTEHNNIRNTNKGGAGVLPRTFIDNQFFMFGSQASSRNETAAFQIWFNKMLNTSQTADLRNIIKQTIGKGLGLP